MNKYQEAFNSLDWFCDKHHNDKRPLFQELVDKETPIKPIKDDQCGKCEVMVVVFNGYRLNYCPNCGQKIDWSDNNL